MNFARYVAFAFFCSLSVASILETEKHDKQAAAHYSTGNHDLKTSNRNADNDKFIDFSGFTMIANDGTGVFHPIFPGADVPSARDENGGSEIVNMPELDVSPSPEEESDAVCFPADARVETEHGLHKRMDQVEVGDRVHVGGGKFSPVFMFTHKLAEPKRTFVKLESESGVSIRLTPGHYLYVNGRLAPAEIVKSGDSLILGDGQRTIVTNVSRVPGRGLYNPQTTHGDIVVDGILASTYTLAVQYSTAHALLAPLRALHDLLGLSLTCFDHGADSLVSLVPSGSQIV